MDIRLLSNLLFLRTRWKGRDRWSAQEIEAHQALALQDLRRAAYAGSEFYRQHHAGLFDAPLSQLGRSFALLTGIEGRVEDVLLLPGITGEVSVHPNVFHNVLDEATIAGWQVIQEPTSLRVMLAGLAASASVEQVRAGVEAALNSAGSVGTDVDVRVVDAVERTALGKAPLVRGLRNRP